MRPPTQTPTGGSARPETARFTCGCGRSVATPAGSATDEAQRCTSCRAHERHEYSLVRTA